MLSVTNTDIGSNSERKIIVLPHVNPLSEIISSNIDSSKAIVGFQCLNKLTWFVKVHKDIDQLLSKLLSTIVNYCQLL